MHGGSGPPWVTVATSIVALVFLAWGLRLLLAVARRSWRDSRAGRIPGPEADRFRAGQERRLAGGEPPARKDEGSGEEP